LLQCDKLKGPKEVARWEEEGKAATELPSILPEAAGIVNGKLARLHVGNGFEVYAPLGSAPDASS
jgi:hypothetical protein